MQMDAINQLEKQWQSIKNDPTNEYILPPNPNGNMLAGLNLKNQTSKNSQNDSTATPKA
jgi:hypothetical protein